MLEAPPCNVGIVGGGVLGMTLALRLTALGCRVTIVEGAAAPVLIPSRAEAARDKLCSIALGVLAAGREVAR